MPTTSKRIHLALTEQDVKEIELLKEHFNETTSQVMKRALILLSYITFTQQENEKSC